MKKNWFALVGAWAVFGLLLTSCHDESTPEKEIGFFSVDLELDIQNVAGRMSSVNTDNWNLIVYDTDDNEILNFADFIDVPTEVPLEEGDYYIFVSSETNVVGFDSPFYTGTSDVFTIVKGDVVPVSVTAALANVKVTISYSAEIQADFTDWETTVSSNSGNLTFIKGESRSGYFIAGEDLLISADLTYTKADLTTSTRNVASTITNTQGKDHYQVTIDYTLENGQVSPITINVDELTNDISVSVEPLATFATALGGSNQDIALDIQQTNDLGFIIIGESMSNDLDVSGNNGGTDLWVIKLDKQGAIEWQNSLGGSALDVGRSIQQTNDGGYIALGHTHSNNLDVSGNHGNSDIWIVKLDASGNLDWQNTIGGTLSEYASSIQQTADNGYVLVGYSTSNDEDLSSNNGSTDIWLVKLDASGDITWENSFGGSQPDLGHSVRQTTDGGYIIAGESYSSDIDVVGHDGENDFWIIKTDASGTMEWQSTIGGSLAEKAKAIEETSDGGFVVAGQAYSPEDNTNYHDSGDVWIVKLNSSGTIVWQKSYGGSNPDFANSLAITHDGKIVVAGYSNSTDGDISDNIGSQDYWVLKLDTDGSLLWENTLGGTNIDQANAIVTTNDGGYAICGWTMSSDEDVSDYNSNTDFWVAKLNDIGKI